MRWVCDIAVGLGTALVIIRVWLFFLSRKLNQDNIQLQREINEKMKSLMAESYKQGAHDVAHGFNHHKRINGIKPNSKAEGSAE